MTSGDLKDQFTPLAEDSNGIKTFNFTGDENLFACIDIEQFLQTTELGRKELFKAVDTLLSKDEPIKFETGEQVYENPEIIPNSTPIIPFETVRAVIAQSEGFPRIQQYETKEEENETTETTLPSQPEPEVAMKFKTEIASYLPSGHLIKDITEEKPILLFNDQEWFSWHKELKNPRRVVVARLHEIPKHNDNPAPIIQLTQGTDFIVNDFSVKEIKLNAKLPKLGRLTAELKVEINCHLMQDNHTSATPYAGISFTFKRYSAHFEELPEREKKRKNDMKEKKKGKRKTY